MNSTTFTIGWRNNTTPASSPLFSSVAKSSLCLLLTGLMTGCWAPSIKPATSELDHLQSILIVPVESPPLEVTPDLLEQTVPAYRHYQNMALNVSTQTAVYQTPGGITVAGRVDGDDPTTGTRESSPATANCEWTPAKSAALKAQHLLSDENLDSKLSDSAYRLPLSESEHGADLQAWHRAIQAWYELEHTPVDYRTMGRYDAVLELGIGGYRIFNDQVSLQVLVKLIDPASRRVIARTRDQSFIVEQAALPSVIEDGEQFKQLIADLSVPLLRQTLGDVGLRTPPRSYDYN